MKKFKKMLVSALSLCLAVSATASFVGCGGDSDKEGVEGTLSVCVYSAGYGFDWIYDALDIYKNSHPGFNYSVKGDSLAFETIKTKLENGNCKNDIILVSSGYYDQFVANGYLEDLTEFTNQKMPGNTHTVKESIPEQILNRRTINGKIYGLPWQENNAGGLIYNVQMFKDYGWDLPTTMDEFWDLCKQIDSDTQGNVAPICFGGADGHGYTDYNPSQWLCEYYGYDKMVEFYNMESPAVFQNQSEGRDKIYKTYARLTMGTVNEDGTGNKIALDGSVGGLAVNAQTSFVEGNAAMIINGQWLPTEMKEYTELVGFEMGYCPMPHINSDKRSGDGSLDTSNIRFSTDGNMMAIPTTAVNKDLAKDFLLSMYSSESYTSFVKANNGLLRPIKYVNVDTSGFNNFTKEAYNYFSGNGSGVTVYSVSSSKAYDKGTIATFMAYKGAYYAEITSQPSYAQAKAVAERCVGNELASVQEQYDYSINDWK